VDKPTQEEIQRVDEWRAVESKRRNEETQRKLEAKEQETRDDLTEKIAGRIIRCAEGNVSYGDFTLLRLVFEDGGCIEISVQSWTTEGELDVEVKGV
jgi:hypothetical protein